jgi:hypothetical protein
VRSVGRTGLATVSAVRVGPATNESRASLVTLGWLLGGRIEPRRNVAGSRGSKEVHEAGSSAAFGT